jgi:hypothetical protein
MGFSRRELCFYEPTEAWLASRNPTTKKQILAWYQQEKNILFQRLKQPVIRNLQAFSLMVDKETKAPLRRSKKATDYEIELWRLSEKDYKAYLQLLEKTFERFKAKHNKRVLERRKTKEI